MQDILYKAIISLVIYTMVDIRIDLAFIVSVVCQHMTKLCSMYLQTINRIWSTWKTLCILNYVLEETTLNYVNIVTQIRLEM